MKSFCIPSVVFMPHFGKHWHMVFNNILIKMLILHVTLFTVPSRQTPKIILTQQQHMKRNIIYMLFPTFFTVITFLIYCSYKINYLIQFDVNQIKSCFMSVIIFLWMASNMTATIHQRMHLSLIIKRMTFLMKNNNSGIWNVSKVLHGNVIICSTNSTSGSE